MRTVFLSGAFLLIFGSVSTRAHAQVAGFPDVPPTHWAAQSVAKLAQAGIVKGQPATAKASPYNGNKPVTRYEMAVTLWRWAQYLENVGNQQKSPENASVPIDGPTAIRNLIAGGYLPKNSPLAQASTKTITANQFADIMAQVITRITEKKVPISPDSRYAPEPPEAAKPKG